MKLDSRDLSEAKANYWVFVGTTFDTVLLPLDIGSIKEAIGKDKNL